MRNLIRYLVITLFLLFTVGCSSQRSEAWQNAYAAFLKEGSFLNDDAIVFQFSLKDLDDDGIPELLLFEEDKNALNNILTVYGYDDQVYKIGNYTNLKGSFLGGFRISDNSMFPGLFEVWWGGGEEHYGYLSLNVGELEYEYLWCNNLSVDPSQQTMISDNELLISESINMFPPFDYKENLLEIYMLDEDALNKFFEK